MNKIYACSDLHGNYNLWQQISKYCDETDKIFYLGDAIDRGPNGLKIMLDLLSDTRVLYLKGNHEDMMVAAMHQYMGDSNWFDDAMYLWMSNGGKTTYDDLMNFNLDIQLSLLKKIQKLPYTILYKNKNNQRICLCHSGCDYENFTDGCKKDYIWNREHIYNDWFGPEDIILVHGHTPVSYILQMEKNEKPVIYKYCNKHKIDIDMGTILTNRTVLLDLDTLEPIYFDDEGEKNE